MAGAFQTSGFAFQGVGQFAFQTDSAPPIPPQPTDGGAGGGHGWTRKREDWRKDKDEIRARLERAINGLEAVPTLAPEVAEIKREHSLPHKRKQAPRVDWDSLLRDARAVNWLLEQYERRIEDDDDDDAFMAMMH